MPTCEKCGREIPKANDAFYMNGKTLCVDCAHPKKCCVCGSTVPTAECCYVLEKPACIHCLFPTGGHEEYSAFKEELQAFNNEHKTEWNTNRRKLQLKYFLIITAIFIAIDAALFFLSYKISGGQYGIYASWILYFLVLRFVWKKKAPSFTPLTEKDYYQKKYSSK